nr:hypothetical protein [Tanacetum cinerariifolium]
MLLLTWHESSEPTKEPVCNFVTPNSLSQHDSSTPCKDSVCESITLRCTPNCMLTPPTDDSIITYTQLNGVQGVDIQSHVLPIIESQFSDINLSFVSQQATTSQEDESAHSDRQFFYNDKGIDNAYKTKYDVQSSKDACTDDDDDDDDDDEDEYLLVDRKMKLWSLMWRRLVELSREMESVINDSGQWKYSFYTSKKFTTLKEAKDRFYLHSIESRRNLKLYKNDSVRIRARYERKVHVFTMSQGTGPIGLNHEMKAGPSGSRGPSTRSKERNNTGLDGAFMKGPFPGQVLAGVGLDSNNGIYPLAYALVEAENPPPEVPMADNRTMAELLQAPTEGYV